ncbi:MULTISPECIES: hypothetical protein [unclassified Streptomyces]
MTGSPGLLQALLVPATAGTTKLVVIVFCVSLVVIVAYYFTNRDGK